MKTTWQIKTYDVWGNKEDGFEVNDVYNSGEVTLNIKSEVYNKGLNSEFMAAFPSDYQIGRVFGFRGKLDISGDDTTIYVNREVDGFPLGELQCLSHSSLSPIKPILIDGIPYSRYYQA